MATSNIAIRFTDDKYLTKNEVSTTLGMSSIDTFWNDILAYRAQYQRVASLETIHKVPFHVTLTPKINQHFSDIIARIAELDNSIGNLDLEKLSAFDSEKTQYLLKSLGTFEGKFLGEMTLKCIVRGTYKDSNADHTSVLRYFDCLKTFINNPTFTLSDEFLAKYYSILIDESELTSFYRTSNLDNTYKFNTTIVGRDYDYAKAEFILPMMEKFFDYVSAGGGDPFAKSILCLFYIDYIKPFNAFNKELACLVAKSIISSLGYERAAGYLNFEEVFTNKERYNKIYLETQRNADITYLALDALDIINSDLDHSFELIEKIKSNICEEEPKVNVTTVEVNQPNPSEFKNNKTSTQLDLFSCLEETNEPLVEEKIDTPKHKEEPILPAKAFVKEINVPKKEFNQIAVQPIEQPTMTDKEIKQYAKYIVETNPSINISQATFFASHCLLNHYYSIQDYKKATKCVYETARTSMDNLVAEGYYQKLQVKNKFIYTPTQKGGR